MLRQAPLSGDIAATALEMGQLVSCSFQSTGMLPSVELCALSRRTYSVRFGHMCKNRHAPVALGRRNQETE